MSRYALYIVERFPPIQMVPLAFLFGVAISTQVMDAAGSNVELYRIAIVSVAMFLFLLRLRLLDDIKDHGHDVEHHTERPGARGVVTQWELGIAASGVAVVEGVIALQFGWFVFTVFLLMSAYSTALFLEALYRDGMRRHFTLYITIHELLLIPFLVYLFLIAGVAVPELLSAKYLLITLYFAALFFLLEVARKVRGTDMEGTGKDTYTAHYGVSGASILLASCASVATLASVGMTVVPAAPYAVLLANALLGVVLGVYLYRFVRAQTAQAAKYLFVVSVLYVACMLLCTTMVALW